MSEFVTDIQARIINYLTKTGVTQETAGLVAAEVAADIARVWQGQSVYISARQTQQDEVRRRFNGRNAREIARELGIGRATVYRILKTPGRE